MTEGPRCRNHAGDPAPTCAYHPGVRAVTRCSACGAPICSGCQRVTGDGRLCEGCHRSSTPPQRGRAGGAPAPPPRRPAPWKLWPALAFLPLPLILNGLMTYMMRQGEEVSVGAAQLLVSLLLYSSTLAFAFIAASRYGGTLARLGMHAGDLPASLGLGLIAGLLAFWMAVAGGILSRGMFGGLVKVEGWLRGFFDLSVKDSGGMDLLIAGIIIVIAAPICEELFFRGYIYPAMRGRLGPWGAALLNGLVFSAVHLSLFGLIGRALAGVVFCLLYEYSDNLWSPIAAHAVSNFLAFFLPLAVIWGS